MKSPEKLLRFLKKKATGKGDFARIARMIPKRKLQELRDRDPDELDAYLLELAQDALELRSDDSPPIGFVRFKADGHAEQYVIYGDASVFVGGGADGPNPQVLPLAVVPDETK